MEYLAATETPTDDLYSNTPTPLYFNIPVLRAQKAFEVHSKPKLVQ